MGIRIHIMGTAGQAGSSPVPRRIVPRRPRIGREALVARPQLDLSEMISLSDNVRIMSRGVSCRLFQQVMRPKNYLYPGHNGAQIARILRKRSGLDYNCAFINLEDALLFVQTINEITGRSFRLPTEEEWLKLKPSLPPSDIGVWVKIKPDDLGGGYAIRTPGDRSRSYSNHEMRHNCIGLLLAEDV